METLVRGIFRMADIMGTFRRFYGFKHPKMNLLLLTKLNCRKIGPNSTQTPSKITKPLKIYLAMLLTDIESH